MFDRQINQMPEPPQLTPNGKEKQLYYGHLILPNQPCFVQVEILIAYLLALTILQAKLLTIFC